MGGMHTEVVCSERVSEWGKMCRKCSTHEEKWKAYRSLVGKLCRKKYWEEDLHLRGRIIVKWMLQEYYGLYGLD
jgi:hypothetical protein